MGQSERSSAETHEHNISSRQTENRSGTAGAVGEVEGATEEGCLEAQVPYLQHGYFAGGCSPMSITILVSR
jgi:hypothetical protein